MQLVTKALLDQYASNDRISSRLDELSRGDDESLTCQKWLRGTPPKRFIYDQLYGDLLKSGPRKRVLDVGGGLTAFTRHLAKHHDYTLVDLLAHDGVTAAKAIESQIGESFLVQSDWHALPSNQDFDIVIANDLFPNVDQRLELFLDTFLPRSSVARLSLTYYNDPRFYITRRVDAEEYLCMLAWNGNMTKHALSRFAKRDPGISLEVFDRDNESVYPNGRQVCLVNIKGD